MTRGPGLPGRTMAGIAVAVALAAAVLVGGVAVAAWKVLRPAPAAGSAHQAVTVRPVADGVEVDATITPDGEWPPTISVVRTTSDGDLSVGPEEIHQRAGYELVDVEVDGNRLAVTQGGTYPPVTVHGGQPVHVRGVVRSTWTQDDGHRTAWIGSLLSGTTLSESAITFAEEPGQCRVPSGWAGPNHRMTLGPCPSERPLRLRAQRIDGFAVPTAARIEY